MKRKSGAKLSRSETVTVRLDPQLRYLAELASRKLRRTVSSFIEWAIEDSLRKISVHYGAEHGESIFDNAHLLWDVEEVDRLVKLATYHPHLLNHQEQLLWKLIRELSVYNPNIKKSSKFYENDNLRLWLIKACWQELKGFVDGTVSEAELRKVICIQDVIPF